jgi:ABC-type lipoprotein export system ATPase subunit
MGSFVRAVNCANIAFPDRGLVAISGKSGCGKSTLLSLLASLEKPSKGRVLYQGQDISSLPPEKLAKYRGQCTGMIFQHYNLFEEDTAIENVELPLLAGANNLATVIPEDYPLVVKGVGNPDYGNLHEVISVVEDLGLEVQLHA